MEQVLSFLEKAESGIKELIVFLQGIFIPETLYTIAIYIFVLSTLSLVVTIKINNISHNEMNHYLRGMSNSTNMHALLAKNDLISALDNADLKIEKRLLIESIEYYLSAKERGHYYKSGQFENISSFSDYKELMVKNDFGDWLEKQNKDIQEDIYAAKKLTGDRNKLTLLLFFINILLVAYTFLLAIRSIG